MPQRLLRPGQLWTRFWEFATVKRFWDTATASFTDDGYAIQLDGKAIRLPSGVPLVVRSERLALAIVDEWQAAGGSKGGEMSFADTPLTRLAGTAIERVAPNPYPTIDAIMRYGESDLLCYRVPAPDSLAQRQFELWQPWIDWAERKLNARLSFTTGAGYVEQHYENISALRRVVTDLDSEALAALGVAVPALGSLVLGLALAAGELSDETAFELSALEELYQAAKWGEIEEATTRRASIKADIRLAARFIALTR